MAYYSKNFDDQIVKLVKNGAVGFMPSDTIYGLSCQALDETAVERIYSTKGRSYNKPMIVLMSDITQAELLALDPLELDVMGKFWPAPVTFICPTTTKTPSYLHRGKNTLAIRIPDNLALRKFIKKVGPVVSTSANIQGARPVDTISKAKKVFSDKLDFYVDTGRLSGEPSTIVRLRNNKLEILRRGAYILDRRAVEKSS